MIEFINVTKKFKNNFWEKEYLALDKVSFKIQKGDLVGFLGANGAGKTTLLKILMDFSRQDSGEIKFESSFGINSLNIKSKIGYLPERAYLYPYLTGIEFIQMISALNSFSLVENSDRLNFLIEKMSLQKAINRPIKGYSKGMQQRLGFIMAILHSPEFLVLDEPLSGLDPMGRREFKKIFTELNQKGTTIFFSSHVVSDVEEICNKVVFIESGKLIYEGSIDKIIQDHSGDNYIIKYLEGEFIRSIQVNEFEKKEKLLSLLSSDVNIIEIEKSKPSLEEIIYKIK